jgi:5'-methylthioadenosine phosphorylase
MTESILGVIGGSGIYDLPGLENVREEWIASPWGEPSGALCVGNIAGLPVVFLSRHDKGHRLSPSDINYRANIDVLKRAGVTDLVSLSACGSFKEQLPPGTFVLVDQFVDRTHKRESSFFGKGLVAHVSMAHPVSPRLRIHLAAAAQAENIAVVRDGTYVCMEGPQFSTLAESLTYKQLGYSVIGMTNMPEAKLAREAELCYATVAMVTDFDCWHPDHDAVTVADLPALACAERVIKESMRLYPPAWGVARTVIKEFEIAGYRVPAGSNVVMSTWIMHRDPRFFPEPEKFDPDRWLPQTAQKLPKRTSRQAPPQTKPVTRCRVDSSRC